MLVHHLYQLLYQFLTQWGAWGYVVVFFGMLVEGDILLFIIAFLTYQGFFDPYYMFATVLVGTVVGDIFWYYAGIFLERYPNFFLTRWVHRVAKPFEHHIQKRLFHTIFIAKFTYGLHRVMILRTGPVGVKLSEFFAVDFVSTFIWTVIFGTLGYLSGASFFLIQRYLHAVELVMLAIVVLFLVIPHVIATYSLKKDL